MTMATPERERPAGGPGAAGTEDRTLHGHHSAAGADQQGAVHDAPGGVDAGGRQS